MNCPVCKDAGSIQKVSAIVAAGTSSSQFSGIAIHADSAFHYAGASPFGATGRSQTDLARTLAQPTEPREDSALSWIVGIAGLGIGGTGLIFGTYDTIRGVPLLGGIDYPLCGIISLGALVAGAFFAHEGSKADDVHLDKMASWRKAAANWKTAYYCHRDGVVFLPGSGARQASSLEKLCYEF